MKRLLFALVLATAVAVPFASTAAAPPTTDLALAKAEPLMTPVEPAPTNQFFLGGSCTDQCYDTYLSCPCGGPPLSPGVCYDWYLACLDCCSNGFPCPAC